MARKKIVDPVIEQVAEQEKTIFFKVNKPLTETEYKLLSDRVRLEANKSGLNIVLIPFSCDVDIGGGDSK